MKLSNSTLAQLAPEVSHPTYARDNVKHGIVHIGVGGFHRAHEAVYTDRLLRQGNSTDWAICGVGVRGTDRAMQQVLAEQDCLYTLIELGPDGTNTLSTIGSITAFLLGPDDPEAVIEKLASAEVRIVSLTITEGGYNVDDNTGRFNSTHPDVRHDLVNPQRPRTVFGYLTEALARRRDRGLAPFTVMSCDNLPENGRVTRAALLAFAQLRDTGLSEWINSNVSFPSSMVDRITPGTTEFHRQWLKKTHGIEDGWPVVCEPFTQWVLEDDFCNGRPEWERVGVQFTRDVAPFERMKIRLLNASHSAMAYLAYLAGYRYTHEVMGDERFAGFIKAFMDEDVTPVLGEISGIDVEAYKQTLIERFSNPQMGDQLSRLCTDGSSKIPKFLLPTVHALLREGRSLERVATIIAGWALYLRGRDEAGQWHEIHDPMAERLQRAVGEGVGEGEGEGDRESLTPAFLGVDDVFGKELVNSAFFQQAFEQALEQLETRGVMAAIESLQSK